MKQFKAFTIKFVGLKEGEHCFEYKIGKTFFEDFKYDEYNDANILAKATLNKKTTLLELIFDVKGTVNVNCDVSNEPFNLEVENQFNLVVKFGNEYNDENDEILIIPHAEYEINIAQYFYELIVLSVPTKRVHPGVEDGSLESDILKKLEELSPKETHENKKEEIDPRWNKLKKLLTDK
ncbi:MAG: DUF177 domain-containing protein [Flavobacteriaceae bacterium]|nr:DUF177 domain-containing protein [Flavobacteriaceae bacterium]